MRKFALGFVIVISWFSLYVNTVFAAFSFSINSVDQTSVNDPEQSINVNVSVNNLPSESYFRVAWQKSNGDTYFGYMQDSSGNWIQINSSQNCQNYYHVSDTSTTSLNLMTKIGNDNASSIDDGNYQIKVRRYTASCASYTDSDPFTIDVEVPTPTPTAAPTSTPISTQNATNSPTAKPATSKPTATSLASLRTVVPTVTYETASDSPELVLGIATDEPSPTPSSLPTAKRSSFPFVFVGFGITAIAIVAVGFWYNMKHARQKTD